jgi:hypothetical protein
MFQPGGASSDGNGKKCKTSSVVAYFEQIFYLQNIIVISSL